MRLSTIFPLTGGEGERLFNCTVPAKVWLRNASALSASRAGPPASTPLQSLPSPLSHETLSDSILKDWVNQTLWQKQRKRMGSNLGSRNSNFSRKKPRTLGGYSRCARPSFHDLRSWGFRRSSRRIGVLQTSLQSQSFHSSRCWKPRGMG